VIVRPAIRFLLAVLTLLTLVYVRYGALRAHAAPRRVTAAGCGAPKE
jgi:hypothetical protein